MGELVNLDEHRRRKEYLAIVEQVTAERRVGRDKRNRQLLLDQLRKSGILEVNEEDPNDYETP